MGTKTKYSRAAKKADDVRLFLKATPGAKAQDVNAAFDISMSYAHKLVARYATTESKPSSVWCDALERRNAQRSDGSSAEYYKLPKHASQLQHLISHKNMNSQVGEIFRSCYRFGEASHSDELRDAKKIMFYAQAEVERLEGL